MKQTLITNLNYVAVVAALGLCGLLNTARAAADDSQFAEGNRSYYAGDYERAIECYQSIAHQEGVSPSLLHNLARAQQEKGDVGPALLNYERASWMAPRDADIRAGLQNLRKDLALPADPSPGWIKPFQRLSLNEWTWLGATAWTFLAGLFLVRGLGARKLPFKTLVTVPAVVLVLCAGGVASRLTQLDRAVVLRGDAPLRVSPYEGAKQVASISEGKTLTVTDSHGEFIKVKVAGGDSGWVAASDLARIAALDDSPSKEAVEVVATDRGNHSVTAGETGG